jgi:GT2 family glycosyltransferase
MLLSIVIVSWNTRELLDKCIASIYACPPPGAFETWVVDNASVDGSVEMVREKYPQVRLMGSQENMGFARANNLAIRESTGKYVVLLNPDTEVKPGAFDILTCFMDEHPNAGGAGPYLLNPDGTFQVSCYPLPTLSREVWRLFHLDLIFPYGTYRQESWNPNQFREVGVLKGACMILRHAALDQVGLMDEDYFMYTEEVDLCYRFTSGGWPLYWVPQARIVHYGGQSVEQVSEEMFLHLYKSKVVYIRKHYGRLAGWVFKLILLGAALPRVIFTPLARLRKSSKADHYLFLAQNYRRLLVSLPEM